ncbi:MAG: biotin-dependent carboxyltransferase family protein [Euryarchaeota archaeon]|nr:biotin-dependent carboxyltransferase family protein [Euryarchaeota archaeon]
MIEILDPGLFSTIQDLGRKGYQKYGVPVSGVMDFISARLVNMLVGNDENSALIEFYMKGPKLKFHSNAYFAIAGDVRAKLNGRDIHPWKRYKASSGDVLEIGTISSGSYGYIAFSGGINTEPILGSRSTYLRANIGDKLKSGDRIPLGSHYNLPRLDYIPRSLVPKYSNSVEARIILGPDDDHFTENGIKTFFSSEYTVTPESDRMGYRLKGPKIEHSKRGPDIITDVVPLGTVQVPGNGQPIIMLADRQTTGGYARIGVVITADIPKVAQLRPGGKIRFKEVTIEKAYEELMKIENRLELIKKLLYGKLIYIRTSVSGRTFDTFIELMYDHL